MLEEIVMSDQQQKFEQNAYENVNTEQGNMIEEEHHHIDRIFPDPQTGLTGAQAAELLRNGYCNQADDSNLKSTKQIVRENTLTFFNLVFFVLAFLLLITGNFINMAFLLIVVANAGIGIFQQLRSRKTLSELNLLAEEKVKVIRDGQLGTVPVHKVVREDIVELSSGDQIPADGPVLIGQVQVNESLITGESDAVTKNPGDPLLSGSFIISGKCRARMDKVGAESYASRLAQKAKEDKGVNKSEMMKSLDRLIHVIGFALIPIGIALLCSELFVQQENFTSAIASMVAALIGMIPEGLYLLTSVALGISVMRLAQRKTLVHEMSAIETLARVDVLCLDKTGTITQPEMTVSEVVYLDEEEYPKQRVEDILNACYTVLDADNDTGKAMAARFNKSTHWPVDQVIPFNSDTKWSAVIFRGQGSYVIGAPEFIMGREYRLLEPIAAPYQQEGCRLLLVAKCETQPIQGKALSGSIDPVVMVVINNPIREEAPETFHYFAQQGVSIRVISGDNPATVSQVAIQAGIEGAERYVDATTLREPSDYEEAVQNYTVFGRVTPDQKRKLIKSLQKAGHTVAMTGDGVNDVLALKDSDCGIAMASGSDAACQVAELVLLDSNFASLPHVVEEGRRVINNIQRSASLYLVKNIMSFFLSLITLFAGFPYPFVPIQLTLISTLTIGLPSFILALEPNHEIVKGKFMQNVLRKALPGGLTNILLIVGIELFTMAFTFERATLSTLATVVMGEVGLIVLYYTARPLNWKRWLLIISMAVVFVILILKAGAIFQLTTLDFQSALVIVVFLLLTPSVYWFFEHIFIWWNALRHYFNRDREERHGLNRQGLN